VVTCKEDGSEWACKAVLKADYIKYGKQDLPRQELQMMEFLAGEGPLGGRGGGWRSGGVEGGRQQRHLPSRWNTVEPDKVVLGIVDREAWSVAQLRPASSPGPSVPPPPPEPFSCTPLLPCAPPPHTHTHTQAAPTRCRCGRPWRTSAASTL
jgi:hypothetical protein